MSRNSSGTYTQPGGTTAVAGATIDPTSFNTLISDLGNELTNSLDRGGRGALTADMNAGGFKVTNAATPTSTTDLTTKAYVDTFMPKAGGTFTGGLTFSSTAAFNGAVTYTSSVAFGSSGANLPDSAVLGLGTGGALLYADPNNVQLRGGVVGIQFARSGDGVILSAVNSAGNFYSVGEIYAQGATGFRFPDSTTQASSFPVPTASAGRAQWVAISTASTSYALPAGGTWAYFVAGFNGSGIFRTSSAGVAAGGSTIYSDGSTTSVTGFAWRYA